MMTHFRVIILFLFLFQKKSSEQTPMIHPTVRKFIGKRPAGMLNSTTTHDVPITSHSGQVLESEKLGHIVTQVREIALLIYHNLLICATCL